jgi:hypothetical protein
MQVASPDSSMTRSRLLGGRVAKRSIDLPLLERCPGVFVVDAYDQAHLAPQA